MTICINDWSPRLGHIVQETFHANDAGIMVESHIRTLPERFSGASLDAYCLMPNHLHLIVGIGIDDPAARNLPSVGLIMDWFKSVTTVEYIRGVRAQGWPRFHQHLWLDGYHDHIVRDGRDLQRIRDYIESNAANWQRDGFYPR